MKWFMLLPVPGLASSSRERGQAGSSPCGRNRRVFPGVDAWSTSPRPPREGPHEENLENFTDGLLSTTLESSKSPAGHQGGPRRARGRRRARRRGRLARAVVFTGLDLRS